MLRHTLWRMLLLAGLVGLVGMAAVSVLAGPKPDRAMAVQTKGLPAISQHWIPDEVKPSYSTLPGPSAVWLVRDGEGWLAFSNRSNHRGCLVNWSEEWQRLYDVCSHAMWDRSGLNVAGPAPRPLDTYPVTVREHGWVEIDLGRVQ